MIVHQAVRMDLPVCFLARFSQCFEEILPIHIIPINVFPPIPTTHDMVNGPGIFDSHLARHAQFLA